MIGKVNFLQFLIDADSSKLQEEVKRSRQTVTGMVEDVSSGFAKLGAVVGGLVALLATGKLIEYADAWGQITSRVNIATGSITAGSAAMGRLMEMSNRVYKPIADTSELFIRTTDSIEQLGYSSKDSLDMVEALSYGLVVSSASAEKNKTVIDAWSKSIMQGKMGLGEFQSVITGAPRLQKALADALGVSNAGLLEMVVSGQLTADKLMLVTSQIEKLGLEADGMPVTMADAKNRMVNSLTELAGKTNELTGFTELLTGGFNTASAAVVAIGNVMQEHKGVIGATLGALGGAATVTGILSVASAITGAGGMTAAIAAIRTAFLALTAVMAANPAGLLMLGIGAAAGAAIMMNGSTVASSKIDKEIEFQMQRLANAEKKLANLGGPGRNTAKLEAHIDAVRKYIGELKSSTEAQTDEAKATDKVTRQQVEAAQASQELAEIRRELYGVSKDYLPTLEKLQKQYEAGRLTEAEYVALVGKLAEANYKADDASKAKTASAKAEQSAYAGLMSSIRAKVAETRLDLDAENALAESDKMRIKLDQELQEGKLKLSAVHEQKVRAAIKDLALLEQEKLQSKEYLRLAEQERQMRLALATAAEQTVTALLSSNQSLREEIELIGLSVEQQAAVLRSRELAVILTKEQTLADMERHTQLTGTMTREQIALAQEIDLLRERLALTDQKTVRLASAAAAEASVAEWKNGIDQIGQALTNSLMEGGRSAAGYIQSMFRTMVLRPVIQGVMQPFTGALAGGLGGALEGAGSSGGGLLGGISNLKSLFGSGSWMGDFGGSVVGGLGELGSKLWMEGFESVGSGMINLSSSLAKYADTISSAGNVLGYASAIFALKDGKFGQAAGAAIGTYFGGPIGAFIGGKLGGLVDKAFGSRGANHSGGIYATNGFGQASAAQSLTGHLGWKDPAQDFTKRGNAQLSTALGSTVDGLLDVYGELASLAKGGVRSLDVIAGFAVNGKHSDEDAYGYFKLLDKATGELLASYSNRALGSDADAAWSKYVGDLAASMVTQLRSADIPSWMDSILAALGDAPKLEAVQEAYVLIGRIDGSFKSFAKTIVGFAGLTGKAQEALLKAMGGIEALEAGVGSYYASYYSEEERRAHTVAALTEKLASYNVELPATRDAYRALLEQQLAAGESGMELAAVLLALESAFASVNVSSADLQKQLEEVQSSMRSFFAGIAQSVESARASVTQAIEQINGKVSLAPAQILAAIEAAQQAAMAAAPSVDEFGGNTEAYAAAVAKFAAQAGTSVNQLSDLRGQVVAWYDEQAALAQQLLGTVDRLRAANTALRMEQLSPEQASATLMQQWQKDYALALSTTGSTQAGYADKMAASLPALSSALKSSSASQLDWVLATAKLAAQSENIADQLGKQAAVDYQLQAVEMLGSIDQALAAIGSQAKSAEQVIADAVNAAGAANVAGLRAIVDALQGKTIPGFAGGGMHLGGWRIVGERGPELEATGAARIFNASQTRSMLSAPGGMDMGALISEIRNQREESRAQTIAIVEGLRRIHRPLDRWDVQGIPEERSLA